MEAGTAFSGDEYVSAIENLQQESDERFADFKAHRDTFQLFADLLSADVESVSSMLHIELIDFQYNSELKTTLGEAQGKADKTGEFLRELLPSFPELSRVLSRVMCLFGCTYMCEELFSTMNFNKSKYRTRLTDAHLKAVLTAVSIRVNMAQLCEQKRCQVSGKK